MILFRNCQNVYPVHLTFSAAHWGECPWTPDGVYGADTHETLRGKPRYRGVQHDGCPKVWPWWRIAKFSLIRAGVHPPTTGLRLWIYTRWGALFADLIIDRRGISRARVRA